MNPLSTLASILGVSVASGVNLYLSVLVLGLAERFHWVSGLPPELHVLGHPVVLAVAGLFYVIEFFADKIPFVTVVWDSVHTVIRPIGGALLALGAAGQLDPRVQGLTVLAGGAIALGAHGTKMGVRILAHTTPEPATHSLVSMAEDLGVVGILALVYTHPYVALAVLAAILLIIAMLLPTLVRAIRFLLAGFAGRVLSWVRPAGRNSIPLWADVSILETNPSGGDPVIQAFSRKVKGAPRLKKGYLARTGNCWIFVHRSLFRTKILAMDEGRMEPVRIGRGAIWDTLIFLREEKPQVFFCAKNWSHLISDPKHDNPASPATRNGPAH